MSVEETILAKARPHMLARKALLILRDEAGKGCRPEIVAQPVSLEPVFRPILNPKDIIENDNTAYFLPEKPTPEEELIRLDVWVSPRQKCNWNRSELFIKQLSCLSHRTALELIGNQEQIMLRVLLNRADLPVVESAFFGQFEVCELSVVEEDPLRYIPPDRWKSAAFVDLYPPPPYSHLMTRPEELKRTPYSTLLTALGQIPESALGIYQVVFSPVSYKHNWHQNVEALLDLEYEYKLNSRLSHTNRYVQQAPSGDLRQMSYEVETKSHNDKPFYFAALRIAIINGHHQSGNLLRSLTVMGSLFQHGGRPLCSLTGEDYHRVLALPAIGSMFVQGLTYRPGFLVNSLELASLVHVPPPSTLEPVQKKVFTLETLPPTDVLSEGTPIGVCCYAQKELPVCIPENLRTRHTHLIGRTGTGKSTVLEHMVLHDISQGQGVVVIDPHGLLIQRLLRLIPSEHADRIIYFDPGNPNWVPLWNPFSCRSFHGPARVADDLISSFKSFFSGWGDRLEHLFRQSFLAVLHLPRGCLLDVVNLLRQKSEESRQLRSRVLSFIDSEPLKKFWKHDFDQYVRADLNPPQNKLGKLVTLGTVGLMFSQGDSAFEFRDIMDAGKVFLADLSHLGSESREILGSLLLSQLHLTALGRSVGPASSNKPFHIHLDEAHRFMTDAMEDLIAETRKFGVSLTLAHQQFSQFGNRKIDALSSVGSTIIFNVGTRDAQYLRRDLQGLVEIEDLITLEVGQAISRIGTEVVRLRTRDVLDIPEDNSADKIIEYSRSRYFRPVDEMRRAIRARDEYWAEPLSSYPSRVTGTDSKKAKSERVEMSPSESEWDSYEAEANDPERF